MHDDPIDGTDPSGMDGGCVYTGGCESFALTAGEIQFAGEVTGISDAVRGVQEAKQGEYGAAALSAGMVAISLDGGKYAQAAGKLLEKVGGAFSEAVAKSVKAFLKSNPVATRAGEIEGKALPSGGVAVQATKAGEVPGSKAVYEKQIDSSGTTVQATKTTYDPQGNIVHVKDKMTGEVHMPVPPALRCTHGPVCP